MDVRFGEKLAELRKRAGLGSQRAAAKSLGTTVNTVWSYENEKTLPDIDYLAKFARLAGADLLELLMLRLRAGGHQLPPTSSETREDAAGYEVPDDLSAVRARVVASLMPPDWSVFLTELVSRGKINVEAVRLIADFWDNWRPDPRYLRHLLADSERNNGGTP